MSNKKALEYTRQHQQRLMETLDPLISNFPVAGFVYMEYLGPTDFFFMASDPAWGDEYLMKGCPGETWENARLFAASQDQPTYLAWSVTESKDPIEQYCVDLGYRYGMNVYKKEGNKIRLWAFDGFNANSLLFYQTNKALLEKFMFYFDEKCGDLFTEERLRQNSAQWVTPIKMDAPCQSSIQLADHKQITARHVSLHNKDTNIILTQRQWEILKHAAEGYSMKDIGRNLKISPRTVEGVIQIIKSKSGLLSRDDLTRLVKKNSGQ